MKHTVIGSTLALGVVGATIAVLPGTASATGVPHLSAAGVAASSPVTEVQTASSASGSTRVAITRAILRSRLLGDVPASDVAVSGIRVAGGAWAGATATPRDGRTDPAQVLLHRAGSTWTVKTLGSYEVGCGMVSSMVRHRLGLHGVCG